jgi:hypothetical protein
MHALSRRFTPRKVSTEVRLLIVSALTALLLASLCAMAALRRRSASFGPLGRAAEGGRDPRAKRRLPRWRPRRLTLGLRQNQAQPA